METKNTTVKVNRRGKREERSISKEFYDNKFYLITILKPNFTSSRNILSSK